MGGMKRVQNYMCMGLCQIIAILPKTPCIIKIVKFCSAAPATSGVSGEGDVGDMDVNVREVEVVEISNCSEPTKFKKHSEISA